jgi:hypothetical protein
LTGIRVADTLVFGFKRVYEQALSKIWLAWILAIGPKSGRYRSSGDRWGATVEYAQKPIDKTQTAAVFSAKLKFSEKLFFLKWKILNIPDL